MTYFENVTIVGCGLIGGSLAMAFKSHGIANRIAGVDVNYDNLQTAVQSGIIDAAHTELAEAVKDADLIILAVPVQQTIRQLQLLKNLQLKKGCIITDVSSTKKEICDYGVAHFSADVQFVGGHPMAGSEKSGVTASNPRLFENAVYILVSQNSDSPQVKLLKAALSEIGAHVLMMDAERHDRIAAAVSHIPHMVAALLVDQVAALAKDDDLYSRLAAGGFRDVTRIASGSPVMWRDILLTNRQPVIELLHDWIDRTNTLLDMVESADSDKIELLLTRTRDWRDALPVRAKGAATHYYEITIDVADKPGIIGEVATILGKGQINLRNIGILENREEVNGQLLLSFSSVRDQEQAVSLLQQHGYTVYVRD